MDPYLHMEGSFGLNPISPWQFTIKLHTYANFPLIMLVIETSLPLGIYNDPLQDGCGYFLDPSNIKRIKHVKVCVRYQNIYDTKMAHNVSFNAWIFEFTLLKIVLVSPYSSFSPPVIVTDLIWATDDSLLLFLTVQIYWWS